MAAPEARAGDSAGTPHKAVARALESKYAERPVGYGLTGNGNLVEVYASPDGATWTIVLTLPNGMSYLVSAGADWVAVPRVLGRGS